MTRFLVVPQWQGSPAARAMHLIDGAEAIAGDLPRAATVRVDVPVEAGDALGSGIRRFSALARVGEALTRELEGDAAEPALVVGGECGVALPAIAHAAARTDALAVVWFDAHADLNAPDTSPSGAFGGMALRAVVDTLDAREVSGGVPGSGCVPAERVILAGAREFDEAETAFVDASGLRVLDIASLADPAVLTAALTATGASAVYLHVDLDVLDPAVFSGVALPVPFGLSLEQLVAAIRAVRAALPLAGASVSGFAPASAAAAVDDLGTILRVVGALA